MLFHGICLHFWDFLASSQCPNPAVAKREKQSCVFPVTPAKERTEECSDHWGFPTEWGRTMSKLSSQPDGNSVCDTSAAEPPVAGTVWNVALFTWTQPTWRCHPCPAQLHLGFRRFCVWLAAAGSGWPPSACPWAAGVCWPRSQFGSCVTQSPDQAAAAGRKFGYWVEGGSVHSCDNELVLVCHVAELFPDNWSLLRKLTFVFKKLCKTRPWFYTDAFPVFCALIPVPVLPSPFPFCICFTGLVLSLTLSGFCLSSRVNSIPLIVQWWIKYKLQRILQGLRVNQSPKLSWNCSEWQCYSWKSKGQFLL